MSTVGRSTGTDDISDSMDMSLSKLQEMVKDREGSLGCCCPWGRKESDMTEQLSNSSRYRGPVAQW